MKIRDIMTDDVAVVSPDSTVLEVAQLMQKHDVGAVPVCEGANIVGLVTDRDIVVRNIAHGKDPHQTPVKDVMTTQVKSANPEMSLSQAAGIMAAQQIRRLPVVDENRLVGMVSLGDLATKAKYDVELGTTLGEISLPSEPEKI
ncbi:MAG: CBS domain-containing protein [Bacteroidota bacterium]